MFIFIHIPHTSGRVTRKLLTNNKIEYLYVHNFNGIKKLDSDHQRYSIIRDPTTRLISEFAHYSQLIEKRGRANYVNTKDYTFDPTNPFEYFNLEMNKNVMCKFLLLKQDFETPITENDVNIILTLIQEKKILFDYLKEEPEFFNLAKLINFEEPELRKRLNYIKNYRMFEPSKSTEIKKELRENQEFIEFIQNENKYDYLLYEKLKMFE